MAYLYWECDPIILSLNSYVKEILGVVLGRINMRVHKSAMLDFAKSHMKKIIVMLPGTLLQT